MSKPPVQSTALTNRSPFKFGLDPEFYRWVVLLAAASVQTSVAFITQGVPALAPILARDLALSKAEVGLVSTAMNVGVVLVVALTGRVVDILGERKVLVFGALFCGLSTIVASRAGGFYFLLVLLLMAGVWSSTATPAGSKAIISWFPATLRGFAMGVRQTGFPLGGFLAALILPAVALQWSWREALLVSGIVAIASAFLCQGLYREPAESLSGTGSGKGRGISGSAMQVLRNRSFWLVSLAAMTFVGAQFIVITFIQLDLADRLGFSLSTTSQLLALAQLGGMAGRIIWGAISDRVFGGRRRPVLTLIGLIIVPMALLVSFLNKGFPMFLVYVIIWFLGFSAIGWNALYVALLSELVEVNNAGLAVGLGLTLTQGAIAIFPPLFGLLIDYTDSYVLGWRILAAIVSFGVVSLLLARRPSSRFLSAGEVGSTEG